MDSANILSILSSLAAAPSQTVPPGADAPDVQLPGVAQQAPVNVMQAAVPPPPQNSSPDPAQVAQAASAASPPMPKPRHSLIDTIGRISDVLATVGGAHPLYQPTLDAREKHGFDVQDHGLAVDSANIKNATDKFDLGDKQNLRVGQAARGLKAIMTQNPNADVGQAWNALASQMQLDPATAQSFGSIFATHPEEIDGIIASMTDPKYSQSKYGGSVVYGKDANGKLIAYQPSLGDEPGRTILPDGVTPVDPMQFVNTGGATVGVGKLSGNKNLILPNSVSPNTAATVAQSDKNNQRTTSTELTIAGMPARSKDGAGGKGGAEDGNVPMYLQNIRQGFADLHGMNALPGEGGALGQVEGAIGRTALGQKVGEQFGTPSAQKRLEIMKNVSQLQQAMLKSLPASATRTKFEQEMLARGLPDPAKMDFKTANTVIDQLYASYQNALRSSRPAAGSSASGGGLPILTPEQAAKLPSGARFRTIDGRELVRH